MIRNALLPICLCFFAGLPALHACTCSNAAPGACPGLKTSDIVFLGTVTDAAFVQANETSRRRPTAGSVEPAATSGSAARRKLPPLQFRQCR